MTFEELLKEWDKDTFIDKTEVSNESIKIPKLHAKYYRIYVSEKLQLKKFESELKVLKLEKYEFYTQGHTKESREKGWELPARGMILKGDIPMYMDADKELIEISLKIGIQQEKVDALESIIKSINNRGFLLKSIVDWSKFVNGVN